MGSTRARAPGSLLAAYTGAAGSSASFPGWFWGFPLIPVIATMLGGRAAAAEERRRTERVLRGALGGVVFAGLVMLASWAAGLEVPAYADLTNGGATLGVPLLTTAASRWRGAWSGGIVGAFAPVAPSRQRWLGDTSVKLFSICV